MNLAEFQIFGLSQGLWPSPSHMNSARMQIPHSNSCLDFPVLAVVVTKWQVLMCCRRFLLLYYVLFCSVGGHSVILRSTCSHLSGDGDWSNVSSPQKPLELHRMSSGVKSFSLGEKSPSEGKRSWVFCVAWYTHHNLTANRNLPNISSVTRKLSWAPDQIADPGSQSRKSSWMFIMVRL